MQHNSNNRKHKKSFYCKKNVKKAKYGRRELDVGMKGFLITCNRHEREAAQEMLNLLTEFGNAAFAQNEHENNFKGEVEDDLNTELKSLRESSNAQFRVVDTGTKNCIFIQAVQSEPCQIVTTIFKETLRRKSAKSRYILRLLPVTGTCKADIEKIRKCLPELLLPFFTTNQTFAINFKVRNNNTLSRQIVLSMVGDIIGEISPLSRVDLSNPHFLISIDVLKTICCVSVLTQYYYYHKYNIQELALHQKLFSSSHIAESSKNINNTCSDEPKQCSNVENKIAQEDINDQNKILASVESSVSILKQD